MPDYSKGKVYRITSGDLTYIGSTCEPTLAKRLAKHVGNYKSWSGQSAGCSSFQLIETGQYKITLIEACPCNSKDELTARERFYIENTVCVNKNIPGRTYKERYEDNKEHILERSSNYNKEHFDKCKEYLKEYRKANRDKVNAKQREYRERKSLVTVI